MNNYNYNQKKENDLILMSENQRNINEVKSIIKDTKINIKIIDKNRQYFMYFILFLIIVLFYNYNNYNNCKK